MSGWDGGRRHIKDEAGNEIEIPVSDGDFSASVAANVAAIADPTEATAEDVANKVNAVIAALIAAGLMEAGA
jgi:hypothetical protein